MPSAPEVTVVIPTRDRWDLLSTAALPSAVGQRDVEVEVVVVDDGSTDATPIELPALDDDRLRVVTHDRPQGVARARNAGIEIARGEWVAFLDDDDLWSPQKLRTQLDVAKEHDALFVYGGAAAVAEDRTWLYSLPPVEPAVLLDHLLSRNVLWGGSSNVVVRSDVVRRLAGFDDRLFQLCDWDLWVRLAAEGRAAACEDIVVGCVVHPRSMLLVSESDVLDEFSYLEAKHRALAEARSTRFDRAVFTRWVALGHRRAGRRGRSALTYLRGAVSDRNPANVPRAIAAVLGPSSEDPTRMTRRRPRDGRIDAPDAEPRWLAHYRSMARKSAQAMSNASSPRDS